MKNILTVFLILGLGAFLMSSCEKSYQGDSSVSVNQKLENHSLGCLLLSAEEYAKIPEAKTPAFIQSKASLILSTPPVANQGADGTSIAWATTYSARSIDWHERHPAAWSNSVNIFSPVYTIRLNGCSRMLYVTTALNLLVSKGACVVSVVTSSDCSVPPTPAEIANAALHKAASYSTVSRTTAAIKSFLAAGKPIIVAGPVNNAFMYLSSGGVLSTFSGSTMGGHCYCVVGYDDTKGAFKFMNSWGTAWASSGYGWIKYGYESTWWQEAYVLN